MSATGEKTSVVSKSACDDASRAAHAFCPVGGIHGDTSQEFGNQVRCLLAGRLLTASLVMLGGFAAFFVRNLFVDIPEKSGLMVPHLGVVALLGGIAALLYYRRDLSMTQLRIVEGFAFGAPALFFAWMQYFRVLHCPANLAPQSAYAYPAETVLPWLILVQIYGFFIPNTGKRAMAVILAMAIAPFVGVWLSAGHCPYVTAVLLEGRLSAMVLWMGIGTVISIFGAHRYGTLRREAFEAKRFGVYTLREKLGAGGMGDVYIAQHQLLKRRCAIKLINAEKAGDEAAIARFKSEVQAAAGLTHPNTIEIYDYGITNDGTFYYAMEYLPGLNLQELVERYGPMPPERVVHLLTQVCSALSDAHAHNLIHRDIKPGNIFAAERGGLYDFAKLLDFGLVKSINPDDLSVKVTNDGAVVGSPLFAAPEAAVDGRPDERSDIYSLGATAYFLLSGRPVFPGENALKVLFAHTRDEPPALSDFMPDVPRDLEAIVMRCLAKNPEDRYASADELREALERVELSEKWSADRAKAWWSSAPTDAERNYDPLQADTAVTAVMQLPG